MAQTTFSGPLATGDRPAGAPGGPNLGLVTLAQTTVINFNNTLVQSASVFLPANSQLVDVFTDVLTPYNSATSATLTVGTVAAGTQYVTSVNAKTGGRNTTSHTAAQSTAMANIGNNTAVVATVTSVGQPTAGQVRVTYLYVQTTADD